MEDVKSSEDWRREFMTMQMLIRESKDLGECRKAVSQVRRKSKMMSVEEMAEIFDISFDFVAKTLELIREYPEKGDEDIAEMVMEAME